MTNTIAVSDKIQGNIGGCETKISKIETGSHLAYSDIRTYATNSCTGQVETFPTWEVNAGFVMTSIIVILIICILTAFIKGE